MKKTPWYPPHIKPVRVGLYETVVCDDGMYISLDYWDGGYWRDPKDDWQYGPLVQNMLQWRGLTEQAK